MHWKQTVTDVSSLRGAYVGAGTIASLVSYTLLERFLPMQADPGELFACSMLDHVDSATHCEGVFTGAD